MKIMEFYYEKIKSSFSEFIKVAGTVRTLHWCLDIILGGISMSCLYIDWGWVSNIAAFLVLLTAIFISLLRGIFYFATRKTRLMSNELKRLLNKDAIFIHYACSSIKEYPIRISAIGVSFYNTTQRETFVLKNNTEQEELKMLEKFMDFLKNNLNKNYLHWSMNDDHYGFKVIFDRYHSLGGQSDNILNSLNRYCLTDFIFKLHGTAFDSKHYQNRLKELSALNGLSVLNFLTGTEEIKEFLNSNFRAISLSVSRKVDNIKWIASNMKDGTLKLNA